MVGRFLGEGGRRFRVDALASQKIVAGNRELAEELADLVEVFSIPAGETLITQGGDDNRIYFVLSGKFDVIVNGRRIAGRGPRTCGRDGRSSTGSEKIGRCHCR
jgi:CRP/FNR family transcriptional regulator, cyclic AMP receptor protein